MKVKVKVRKWIDPDTHIEIDSAEDWEPATVVFGETSLPVTIASTGATEGLFRLVKAGWDVLVDYGEEDFAGFVIRELVKGWQTELGFNPD